MGTRKLSRVYTQNRLTIILSLSIFTFIASSFITNDGFNVDFQLEGVKQEGTSNSFKRGDSLKINIVSNKNYFITKLKIKKVFGSSYRPKVNTPTQQSQEVRKWKPFPESVTHFYNKDERNLSVISLCMNNDLVKSTRNGLDNRFAHLNRVEIKVIEVVDKDGNKVANNILKPNKIYEFILVN